MFPGFGRCRAGWASPGAGPGPRRGGRGSPPPGRCPGAAAGRCSARPCRRWRWGACATSASRWRSSSPRPRRRRATRRTWWPSTRPSCPRPPTSSGRWHRGRRSSGRRRRTTSPSTGRTATRPRWRWRAPAPVRWCASRLESFLGDTAGRDGVLEGELALDAGGRILALRVRTFVGIGAYTSTFSAIFATNNTKNCLSSVYEVPLIQIDVKMVLTNAAPLGPYRGAGRPEALYLIERLLDGAARATGIDRVELRRRNFIAPSAMPYRAANGQVYDSGEVEAGPGKALALAGRSGE